MMEFFRILIYITLSLLNPITILISESLKILAIAI